MGCTIAEKKDVGWVQGGESCQGRQRNYILYFILKKIRGKEIMDEIEYKEFKEELDRLLDNHLKMTYNERAEVLERILDLIFG